VLDKCIDLVNETIRKTADRICRAVVGVLPTFPTNCCWSAASNTTIPLMHNDFSPYYVRVGTAETKIDYSKKPEQWMLPLQRGVETDLIEIPANWYLDDLPPMMFIRRRPTATASSSARYRADLAGSVRLGLSRNGLRGVADHHPPRVSGRPQG